MDNLISRQAAIDEIKSVYEWHDTVTMERLIEHLNNLQPIQPVATDTNVGDKISKFIDGLEEIFAGLRERHVDDSVCGLCEYDGAYLGQSGDWCNECPGFEKDDCFKLSGKIRKEWTDEIIKALPSAQPVTHEERTKTHACDLISRKDAIDLTYAETVNTNPEHFKSSEKFIGFMDDIDISDFGRWQWANGFNTALVATKIQLEKLPSAEPRKKGKWILHSYMPHNNYCSNCEKDSPYNRRWKFCPNCGSYNGGEEE